MLTIGQDLYWVPADPRDAGRACPVKVLHVGRKWAKISNNEKINIETFWADGGKYNSTGRCWLNKKAFDQETLRRKLWLDFQSKLCHLPTDGVTIEIIKQVSALLEIPLIKDKA